MSSQIIPNRDTLYFRGAVATLMNNTERASLMLLILTLGMNQIKLLFSYCVFNFGIFEF